MGIVGGTFPLFSLVLPHCPPPSSPLMSFSNQVLFSSPPCVFSSRARSLETGDIKGVFCPFGAPPPPALTFFFSPLQFLYLAPRHLPFNSFLSFPKIFSPHSEFCFFFNSFSSGTLRPYFVFFFFFLLLRALPDPWSCELPFPPPIVFFFFP